MEKVYNDPQRPLLIKKKMKFLYAFLSFLHLLLLSRFNGHFPGGRGLAVPEYKYKFGLVERGLQIVQGR